MRNNRQSEKAYRSVGCFYCIFTISGEMNSGAFFVGDDAHIVPCACTCHCEGAKRLWQSKNVPTLWGVRLPEIAERMVCARDDSAFGYFFLANSATSEKRSLILS